MLPVFFLSVCYVGFADSEGWTSGDCLEVLEIAGEEIAVELLEDFGGFYFEIVEIEVRIVSLHVFNCFGT